MVIVNRQVNEQLSTQGNEAEIRRFIIDQVKVLLGWEEITKPNKEVILDFLYELIIDEVQNYCHLIELPKQLWQVVTLMIIDVYRQTDLGQEIVRKEPTSVKRGDVTISYKVPFERSNDTLRNATYMVKNTAFMKDYYHQLNAFRRVNW